MLTDADFARRLNFDDPAVDKNRPPENASSAQTAQWWAALQDWEAKPKAVGGESPFLDYTRGYKDVPSVAAYGTGNTPPHWASLYGAIQSGAARVKDVTGTDPETGDEYTYKALVDKNGNPQQGALSEVAPGVYKVHTTSGQYSADMIFGTDPKTGYVSPITDMSKQYNTWRHDYSGGGIGGIISDLAKGIMDLGPLGKVAMAYAIAQTGGAVGAALGVGNAAGIALVNGGLAVANGSSVEDAVKAAGTSLVSAGVANTVGGAVNQLADQVGSATNYGTDMGSVQNAILAAQDSGMKTAGDLFGDVAGKTAGAIAGAETKSILTGKPSTIDPLMALQTAGATTAVPAITSQIDGFDQLPKTVQNAVNAVVTAELSNKDPTQILINQALQAGKDVAKSAYNEYQSRAVDDGTTAGVQQTINDLNTGEADSKTIADTVAEVTKPIEGSDTQTSATDDAQRAGGKGSGTYFDSEGRLIIPAVDGEEEGLGDVTPEDLNQLGVGLGNFELNPEVNKIQFDTAPVIPSNIDPSMVGPVLPGQEPLQHAEMPTPEQIQAGRENFALQAGFPNFASYALYDGNIEQYKADQLAEQNHQAIMNVFHQVLGRDPTPEEYIQFAGQNAIDVARSIDQEYLGTSGVSGVESGIQSGVEEETGLSGFPGLSGAESGIQSGAESGTGEEPGRSGFSGVSGQSGVGESGESGSGVDTGTSGFSGFSGTTGTSGTSGTSGTGGTPVAPGVRTPAVDTGLQSFGSQFGSAGTGTTAGPTRTPIQDQFLTSKGNVSKFVSPLAHVLALSRGMGAEENPEQQGEQPMQTPHYSYGNSSSIDEILGLTENQPVFTGEQTAATGGLMASPLMAAGGMTGTRYGQYAKGGLPGNVVHHSGKARVDFREGDAVTGPGDGQSDDIPAMLADGEFVFPADVVAAIGNGSTKAGSDKLYDMMHSIRAHVRSAKPQDLPPEIKSPLDFLSKKHRKA